MTQTAEISVSAGKHPRPAPSAITRRHTLRLRQTTTELTKFIATPFFSAALSGTNEISVMDI